MCSDQCGSFPFSIIAYLHDNCFRYLVVGRYGCSTQTVDDLLLLLPLMMRSWEQEYGAYSMLFLVFGICDVKSCIMYVYRECWTVGTLISELGYVMTPRKIICPSSSVLCMLQQVWHIVYLFRTLA
jgi:hypothetical protein